MHTLRGPKTSVSRTPATSSFSALLGLGASEFYRHIFTATVRRGTEPYMVNAVNADNMVTKPILGNCQNRECGGKRYFLHPPKFKYRSSYAAKVLAFLQVDIEPKRPNDGTTKLARCAVRLPSSHIRSCKKYRMTFVSKRSILPASLVIQMRPRRLGYMCHGLQG